MSMRNPTGELFISVDVETDGPFPLTNNLLSIGAVAFFPHKVLVDDIFEVNLDVLENCEADPDTLKWWKTQPEAWEAVHQNLQDPKIGIIQFVDWVDSINVKYKSKPIFAGFPAGFDFSFIYTYCGRFAGRCPMSFQSWDAKTYASAVLKIAFRDSVKSKFPKEWFSKVKHTHKAIDDALGQAYLFQNMLKQNLGE